MHQVPETSLWLGHCGDTHNLESLWGAGIEAIVDLALNEPIPQLPRDFIYCRFPLMDGAGNSESLLRLAILTTRQFLESQVKTLVACSVGMSRAPAVATAALASMHKGSLDDWLHKVSTVKSMDLSLDLWADVARVASRLQASAE